MQLHELLRLEQQRVAHRVLDMAAHVEVSIRVSQQKFSLAIQIYPALHGVDREERADVELREDTLRLVSIEHVSCLLSRRGFRRNGAGFATL